MKVEELDIPQGALDVIKGWGIEELYPPQSGCVKDVLSGKNCVLAFPTASGKSLLAYLAIIKRVIEEGGKALYIVPLRALASEKVEDLDMFSHLGVKVAVSMGDYDRPDPNLKNYDVIVATSEKADSLLRQNVDWLNDLNLMIADEIHLINDRDRGSTLEVTLSKLKQVNPAAQIVALSATIRNSETVAEWLGAEHHKSEWRPVELSEGVYFNGYVYSEDGSSVKAAGNDPVSALTLKTIKEGGQCLVFVSTRRSTESVSVDLASHVRTLLTEEEKCRLGDIAKELEDRATTSVGKKLATVVSSGTAFHNAGLNNHQRKVVEKAFKARLIKVIGATPTLAAGINLPARLVIIRDWKRYDPLHSTNAPIPVMEIKQMCGRAGRPGYDDIGEAIMIARRKGEVNALINEYIYGESEVVLSRMAMEPALRKHLLALIATSHCRSKDDVSEFMAGTFFARCGGIEGVWGRIEEMLDLLEEYELIIRDKERMVATEFGKRVSDLYIDPLSGLKIRDAVMAGRKGIPISFLHIISGTPDMYQLYIKKSDVGGLLDKVDMVRPDLFEEVPEEQGELEAYLSAFKTAMMLNDWIAEESEETIADRYDIGPGDIRNRVETAEWLLHSASEIARMYDPEKHSRLRELTLRMKYGINDDLIELMRIPQVGRVRARTLYNAGYKTPEDVVGADPEELRRLPGIGDRISATAVGGNQSSLMDF